MRLISGLALNALESQPTAEPTKIEDVERVLRFLEDAAWQQVPAVGEGKEVRAETEAGQYASKLTLQGRLVHASVVAAE